MMNSVVTGLGAGISLGVFVSFFINGLFKRKKLNRARRAANDIIGTGHGNKDLSHTSIMDNVEAYKIKLLAKQDQNQEEITRFHRRNKSEIDRLIQQENRQWQKHLNEKNKTANEMTILSQTVENQAHQLKVLQNQLNEKQQSITANLQKKFHVDVKQLQSDCQAKYMTDTKAQLIREIKNQEEHFAQNLNREAHFILYLILGRFCQPYCSERGIKAVVFSSQSAMQDLLGSDWDKMKLLEKECGVDMKVSDTEPSVTIFGIDPVRRELGRAVLQQVAQKSRLKVAEIKPLVQNVKRQLFYQIKNDGEKICQALNLQNVKTEVKNLMGALRYRYSFAQNQYFHCLEVGWLCGLLNAELGMSASLGRRAGMFHDIGKVIDYSKEGGHAVIGADFIQKYQEAANIVHAVRAHHYDVAPEEPLDFLVIAADALSGARPGARRSTLDFYNQKLLTLEKIGRSFQGVKDTYIMSAGREMRVIVDSRRVSDSQALDLSKKIARRIEEECSYPGLIKVTVVRTVTCQVVGQQDWDRAATRH